VAASVKAGPAETPAFPLAHPLIDGQRAEQLAALSSWYRNSQDIGA